MLSFLTSLALFFGMFQPAPATLAETEPPPRPTGGGGFINNGPALNGQHTRPTSEILPEGGIQLRVQGGQLRVIR